MDKHVSQMYYVYTLAYPDGRIFYVGKGTANTRFDRSKEHELETRRRLGGSNSYKQAVIREIWAQGGEVVKAKVAYFADEQDAYMYEWALINMTCYASQLTNLATGPSYPRESRFKWPELENPICLQHGKVGIIHQVTDLIALCRQYGMSMPRMKEVVEGERKAWRNWSVVQNCECQTVPLQMPNHPTTSAQGTSWPSGGENAVSEDELKRLRDAVKMKMANAKGAA